jgi:hypothetical protein
MAIDEPPAIATEALTAIAAAAAAPIRKLFIRIMFFSSP